MAEIAPTTLPLSRIKSSDAINARREADTDLEQLAASIAAKGLIQPLVVRPASKGDAYLEAVRDLFDPADFFARAPKNVGLAAIEEMREVRARHGTIQSATELAKMKKSDVAHVATLAAKACGWLPELLRHPDYRIDGGRSRLVGQMAAAEQTNDSEAAEVASPPKRARMAG